MTVLDVSLVDSKIAMHIPWNCKEVVWGSEQQANLVEILQHVYVSARDTITCTYCVWNSSPKWSWWNHIIRFLLQLGQNSVPNFILY